MMAREWHGIDRLRLDKYYVLMRCFLRECLVLVQRTQWDIDRVNELANMLSETVLHACVPIGLRYFMLDSVVPAVQEVTVQAQIPESRLLALIEPYIASMGSAPDDHMMQVRARHQILPCPD